MTSGVREQVLYNKNCAKVGIDTHAVHKGNQTTHGVGCCVDHSHPPLAEVIAGISQLTLPRAQEIYGQVTSDIAVFRERVASIRANRGYSEYSTDIVEREKGQDEAFLIALRGIIEGLSKKLT